jgi:hypothetical protein
MAVSNHRVLAFLLLALCAGMLPVKAATLAGVVTRADNGLPVERASIVVLQGSGFDFFGTVESGPTGAWQLTVPAGVYRVFAFREDLVGELYDNVPCPFDTCDGSTGTPVTVGAATVRNNIDFALAPRGSISGVVTREDTGVPLAGVSVFAMTPGNGADATATTAADGSYTLLVTPGPRRVLTDNAGGYIDEYHANLPCPLRACDATAATAVSASPGTPVTGIDFALARGGRIAGSLVDSDGAPIGNGAASVLIARTDGTVLAGILPQPDGSWAVDTGLPAGSYRIAAQAGPLYAPRVWNNRSCPQDDPDACDLAGGDPVVVTVGATTAGIAMVLPRLAARLQGRVTRFADGLPFEGVQVVASNGPAGFFATTDASGQWRIDDLPAGSYVLEVNPPFGSPERGERWPGLQCEFPGLCPTGTPVVVAAGETRGALDFQLAPLALLELTLRNADTAAAMRGEFRVRLPTGGGVQSYFANAAAAITVPIPDGGAVRFAGGAGECGPAGDRRCVTERFPDTPCPNFSCTLLEGGAVTIAKGATASAQLSLAVGARISGRVVETGDLPIEQLPIEVVDANNAVVGVTATANGSGDYFVDGLAAGTYYVRTRAPSQFIDEIWDDRPCPNATCAPATGTPIVVTPGQQRGGIDFTLARGGGLSGRVTNELSAQGVAGVSISIHDATGTRVATAISAPGGSWISPVLANGSYTVGYSAAGFDAELYDNLPCPQSACDPTTGTALQVAAPATVTGLDAVLTPQIGALPPRVLYLNRCAPTGCLIRRGNENSVNDVSSILPFAQATLPAYSGGDAAFAALAGCVRASFANHNVQVVTVNPGAQSHWEVMVGGSPQNLGFPGNVAGVAPWAGGGLIPNAIAFVFATVFNNDPFEVCDTTAHEAGHLMGLDHAFHAPDHMSYLVSPVRSFVDLDVPCGTSAPRTCDFGTPIQNTYRRLGLTVGFKPLVFTDGFEPAASASILRRVGSARYQGLSCGTDTARISLAPPIHRQPSGPTVRAADARRP